jgi:hypothetical protein
MTDQQRPQTLGLKQPIAQGQAINQIAAELDDPRVRAARRAAELRSHGSLDEDGTDKFWIDPKIIPDGWAYEWKVQTVLNMPNPGKSISDARAGWEPVPASRHPEMMPQGHGSATIDRDGQRLMERPAEITAEAKARDYRRAVEQVTQKERQITGAPAGSNSPFPAHDKNGRLISSIGRSSEQISIPK